MARRDKQIDLCDVLQNKAHEVSFTCLALLPETYLVLICGYPKMENLLPPLGACFTIKNGCPAGNVNTSGFIFPAVVSH